MSLFTDDDRQQWVQAFLQGIPYARTSGMTATQVSRNNASLSLPPRITWTGDASRQLIHTGCLSVLADTACGVAVGVALEAPEPFATLDLRMDYLRPAVAETELICWAECYRLSRSVAFVRGELRQPGRDEIVATVNANFMRATANKPRRDGSTAASLPTPHIAAGSGYSAPVSTPDPTQPELPPLPVGLSPYVEFLGVQQRPQLDAGPVFRMPFKQELIGNPVLPALHGGVLAGFGETAMVLHLVHTNAGLQTSGNAPRGVDFAIDYLRSAKPADTFAQSTTIRKGNRVALVQVSLWQDDPQRPVATARGHFLLPQDAVSN